MILTINGISEGWLSGSVGVSDVMNDRSTCNFLVDTDNDIQPGMDVVITDGATKVFAGTVDSFTKTNIKGTNVIRYSIACIDYNQLADKRKIITTYTNKTLSYIANDIVSTILTQEGITTGSIVTGPTIAQAQFNYISVTDAFNKMKDLTGVNWNINFDKQLEWFNREDNVDPSGLTESDMLEIEIEKTREQYRNRQYIRAGKDTTTVQLREVPTPAPDGKSKTFSVRYPIAAVPTIRVNSATVSSTSVGINGLDTGKWYYWNKNVKEVVQDDSQATLISTDSIDITYQGLVDIVVAADNGAGMSERKAAEPNSSGIYEAIQDEPSIDNRQAALDFAKGLLQKYATITERVKIRTRTFKQAGKLINLYHAKLGVNGNYLIESVEISEESGIMFYDIVCLSGESLGSWVEFFRSIRNNGQQYIIKDNEIFVKLVVTTESVALSGQHLITVYDALLPSLTLYPSTTLYPNPIQKVVTVSD